MIGRRAFLAAASAAVALASRGASAQAPRRPRIIAFPNSIAADRPTAERIDRFLATMRNLGYFEGQDFAIDLARTADIPSEVRRQLALPADVLITQAGPATTIAAAATSTVPIVAVGLTAAAVRLELVGPDLGRPKGNVTGIGLTEESVAVVKAIELARELLPRAAVFGLLHDPSGDPSAVAARVRNATDAAARSGFRLAIVEQNSLAPLATAFAAFIRERADVVYSTLLFRAETPESEFRRFSTETRVLVLYSRIENVEAGGLLAYAADTRDYFVRAAHFVDRLIRGANIAELPFEQYSEFRLAINLKTAREMSFAIPPLLLARADVVIE